MYTKVKDLKVGDKVRLVGELWADCGMLNHVTYVKRDSLRLLCVMDGPTARRINNTDRGVLLLERDGFEPRSDDNKEEDKNMKDMYVITKVEDLIPGDRVLLVGSRWDDMGVSGMFFVRRPSTSNCWVDLGPAHRCGRRQAINNTDRAVVLLERNGNAVDAVLIKKPDNNNNNNNKEEDKNMKEYMIIYRNTGAPVIDGVFNHYEVIEQINMLIGEGYSKDQLRVLAVTDVPFDVEIVPAQVNITVG